MSRAGSPEFDLVAACCRWPPSDARNDAIRRAVVPALDWARVERVTARHRVAGFVRDGLKQAGIAVPADNNDRIAEAAKRAAHLALDMARESLRLQQAFDAADVPALFVKGSSLAMLAFGQLGIKQSWDIDLVTTPEQGRRARALLEQSGYVLSGPALSAEQFDRLVEWGKEAEFHHPVSGLWVELHWRLIDNASLLADVAPFEAVQAIPLAGATLRTLNDDALFAYLCVHGTMHAWARLKWLADVAAFLAKRDSAEIDRLYEKSLELGAGRAPAVTLLLCARLLGTPLSPALAETIQRDRTAVSLADNALSCLMHGRGETEIGSYSLAGLRIVASQFFVGGTSAYVRGEMRRRWISERDRNAIALPEHMAFLYHLLRVPLWLSRLSGRVFNKPLP